MATAQDLDGESISHVTNVCKRLNTYTIFGTLERDGQNLYNACLLVGPNGLIASYRKIHLPSLGIDRFVTPGDKPFAVYDVKRIEDRHEYLLRRVVS